MEQVPKEPENLPNDGADSDKKPLFNSKDIFTIPNAMSITGGILTWHGAGSIESTAGLSEVIIGRIIDVLDGAVARATGQTSNLGAGVDASIDKAATAKLLCDLTRKNAAPKPVIGTIALLNTINAAATGITNMRNGGKGFSDRPSKSGKLAMAGETVTLFAYAGAYTAEHNGRPGLAKILRNFGCAALIVSLPFATRAAHEYLKRAAANNDDDNNSLNY